MNNSRVVNASESLEYLLNFYCFHGIPANTDNENEILILINHSYAVGFSPKIMQPAWSAYRVAEAKTNIPIETNGIKKTLETWYERPHLYYDDQRLPSEFQIGTEPFGKLDDIQLNVGHMTPNYAIAKQFGRLAQMETFLMSNMSPQFASLNKGLWQKMEDQIINTYVQDREHLWIITGPIFINTLGYVNRKNDIKIPIPSHYYCIAVDPFQYPWNNYKNAYVLALLIPQNANSSQLLFSQVSSVKEIEDHTKLRFFSNLSNHEHEEMLNRNVDDRHRLYAQLGKG